MNLNIKKVCSGLLAIVIMITMGTSVTGQTTAATTKSLYVGATYTFKIKGTDKKIQWSSSNPKVASVNQKGKVTAKKVGSVTITAKYGKIAKKYIVKVNHKILKYISKDWYTIGNQPYQIKYKFTNKYRKCYICDMETGKYSYYGKDKVSYTKTEYGYYITVYTSNGKGGYRLTLDGQSKGYGLECMGDGNPYSEDGYSASSSLE